MCIVFLILSDTKSPDTYHSILCHGRDEVLSRPTTKILFFIFFVLLITDKKNPFLQHHILKKNLKLYMRIVFLILSDTKSSNGYHSILCHGRDEVLSRPTLRAHQWTSPGGVFAGRDRVANGTVRSISIHFLITNKRIVVSQKTFGSIILMWMRVQ